MGWKGGKKKKCASSRFARGKRGKGRPFALASRVRKGRRSVTLSYHGLSHERGARHGDWHMRALGGKALTVIGVRKGRNCRNQLRVGTVSSGEEKGGEERTRALASMGPPKGGERAATFYSLKEESCPRLVLVPTKLVGKKSGEGYQQLMRGVRHGKGKSECVVWREYRRKKRETPYHPKKRSGRTLTNVGGTSRDTGEKERKKSATSTTTADLRGKERRWTGEATDGPATGRKKGTFFRQPREKGEREGAVPGHRKAALGKKKREGGDGRGTSPSRRHHPGKKGGGTSAPIQHATNQKSRTHVKPNQERRRRHIFRAVPETDARKGGRKEGHGRGVPHRRARRRRKKRSR